MASAKRTHDVLTAIRRNSCYNSGRTILLVVSVILALLSLVAGTSLFTLLDKEEPMAVLLAASVVLGGGSLAFLTNYLGNVFMDGADSLLQVAKFSLSDVFRRSATRSSRCGGHVPALLQQPAGFWA